MTGIEKKKSFIISVLHTTIVLALFYLFFKYAFGLFLPFIVAVLVAMILQKPINFITSKTPLKRGIVSVFFVLICSLLIFLGIGLVFVWIGTELKGFFQYIMIQLEDIPSFVLKIEDAISQGLSFLPNKIEEPIVTFIGEKLNGLLNPVETPSTPTTGFDISSLATPLLGVLDTAKQIPTTIVSIFVAIITCCFMASDFDTVKKIILSLFKPDTRDKVVRAKHLLFPTFGKMAKAYALIITITFTEVSLGLFVLQLMGIYESGYIFIIAGIIALVDIVPVLGTGTILIPWAAYSLFTGNFSMAIGLAVMYVCITVIRQIIEPKLVAAQLGIPPFTTIMAMYIGTRIFGFIGLFLLPITIVMVKMLNDEGIIHVFHKLEDEASEATDEEKEE